MWNSESEPRAVKKRGSECGCFHGPFCYHGHVVHSPATGPTSHTVPKSELFPYEGPSVNSPA